MTSIINERQRYYSVGVLYGVLLVAAFLNAIFPDIVDAVEKNGALSALLSGGGVDPVLIFALLVLARVFVDESAQLTGREAAVAVLVTALIYVPIPWFSWLAVTLIGLRTLLWGRRDVGWLCIYLAFPKFWGLIPLKFIGVSILGIDAYIVSFLTGYEVQGNMLIPPDGSTPLTVLWGCSSFHGISYSILAWLAFAVVGGRKAASNLHWLAFGIAGVIAINLLRLTLMTVFDPYYENLHIGTGAQITSLVLFLWMVAIPFLGQKTSVKYV